MVGSIMSNAKVRSIDLVIERKQCHGAPLRSRDRSREVSLCSTSTTSSIGDHVTVLHIDRFIDWGQCGGVLFR
jgi:hypothetical protein